MKLNQFFPCNPHHLNKDGCRYWTEEFASREEILNELEKISTLTPVSRKVIDGDNPTYDYFYMDDKEVIVGLLTLFSLKYPCGRCHKLRVQPSGNLSICLQQQETYNFVNKNEKEIEELIKELFEIREKLDETQPNRQHFRAQLGELRFGCVNEAKDIKFFEEELSKKKSED